MNQAQTATGTFAIPMMNGRELLLQAPVRLTKSEVPFLELLESYVKLMKTQAQQNSDEDANSGNDD